MQTKTKLLTVLVAAAISQQIKAQGVNSKWDKSGDAANNNNLKIGTTNNYDFNIITNNQIRGVFTKNGKFNFNGAIKTDTLKTDSLIVNGGARIKGRLHVGQNSMWFGNTGFGATDDVTSTNGNVNIGGESPLPFSQIKVGIGIQTPNQMVHIHNGLSASNLVRQQFTNLTTTPASGRGFLIGILANGNANFHQQELNRPLTLTTNNGFTGVNSNFAIGTAFNPQSLFHINDNATATYVQVTNNNTGVTATDGLRLGILANGIAQLKQQENLDLQFHTFNTQRMVIKNTGFVGINTNTPGNQLELNSALASAATPNGGPVAPGFGPPTGASGLRFSDIKSTSIPQNNTSGKILSVNAAGDVILVPDGGTAGPSGATAKNGLNVTVGAPDVELGGNLLHQTSVIMNNTGGNAFDLVFNGAGQFGVGNNAVPGSLGNSKVHFTHLHNGSTSFNELLGLDYTALVPLSTIAYGINNIIDVDNSVGTIGSSSIAKGNTQNNQGVVGAAVARTVGGANSNYGVLGYAIDGNINYGGSFSSQTGSSASNAISIGLQATAQGGGINTYGGYFSATDNSGGLSGTGDNRGIYTTAYNSSTNPGAFNSGIYSYADATTSGKNHAVLGIALNGATSIGVSGIIGNNNTGLFYSPVGAQIGIYGYNPSGAASANYAGYFEGDVYINGNGIGSSSGIFATSDQMFKTNVDTITNAKSIIKLLQPKQYYFDTTNAYGMKFSNKKQYGFIAQQVQTILPELLSTAVKLATKDSLGAIVTPSVTYKTLNYNAFIALLMKGMQEQQRTIDSIRNVLSGTASLRGINPTNGNTSPEQTNSTTLNKQNVTLSNADMLVLDQNQPNPFSESTVIKYNVPEKYGYAQLIFTTTEGRILKTMDVAKKGLGEITVYAGDLSSGIYNYTLVVDGKTIDTKKMMKQN